MLAQLEFSRSSEFQDFLRALFGYERINIELVQGVTIDFHPLWLLMWDAHQRTGSDIEHYDFYWPLNELVRQRPRFARRPNPNWRPGAWKHFSQRQGKGLDEPFIVKISITPGGDSVSRNELYAFADQQKAFFCTVEERPVARAAANVQGSTSMMANDDGTLGGFLKDQNTGKIFGVTCAHVATTPNTQVNLTDVGGTTYNNAGTVTHTTYSNLVITGARGCNNTITWQSDHVDIALFEPDAHHTPQNTVSTIGLIDAIFDYSQFDSGTDVVMRGTVSGKHTYQVGAFCAIYRVLFNDGNFRCFNNIFEITSSSGRAPWLPQKIAIRPAAGDSGAWVCADSVSGNYAYCGTLIAVDDFSGYACFAQAVRDWAIDKHNIDLVPF